MFESHTMIKTFLFDLGNVLLFFSHDRMCEQIGQLCDRSADEIRELIFTPNKHLEYERGEMTEAEFQEWLEQQTSTSLSRTELRRATGDIFQPNESMFPLLKELSTRGHRLVLLSNTNYSHIAFVRDTYSILDEFDHLILSYEVGAVKPEAAIFEEALARIECRPEDCFYTDDIPEYVEWGRSFGLRAEVFTNTEQFVEQLESFGIQLRHLL